MLFLVFIILSAFAAALYIALAAQATVWGAVGVFVLGYLGLNVLFVAFFFLHSLFLPRLEPEQGIEKQRPFCRGLCRVAAQFVCGWLGARPRFKGLDKLPDTPFLFVCNHRSGFDPLIVIGWLDKYNIAFVSKPSNLEIPGVGKTVRHVGYLALNRENNREALKTILQAADYLKRGVCSIGIYPEGTRSRSGELLPFHAGSFKIAQKAGVPVAVACVRGTENVKKHHFLLPTPVELEILELIPVERVKAMSTADLADEAKRVIAEGIRS